MDALVCPECKGKLVAAPSIRCQSCGREYACQDAIYDFVRGRYYDNFEPGDPVTAQHAQGLDLEVQGAQTRAHYYAALIQRRFSAGASARVLDCGCGNGLVVEHLRRAGFDAWGNDNSALRKWQWRDRACRDHLVVADGGKLPFDDAYFDVVICSGVLEHVGVDELGGETYSVTPRPTRDEERIRFLSEMLRVTRPGGCLYLDFPNGAFPIDFWHGVRPGGARLHSTREGFLPTQGDVAALLRRLALPVRVRGVSPHGRLAFRQVSTRMVGRLLAPLGRLLFWSFDTFLGRWLIRTPINPYLVLQVERLPATDPR